MRFVEPQAQDALPDWYRAADVTVVPSYSESFGLVAIESQACGTPVVAASVGGLRTAVADGRSVSSVPGHDPDDYAAVLAELSDEPRRRAVLGRGAVDHAARFGLGCDGGRRAGRLPGRARRARAAGGHRGQPVTVRPP